MVSTFAVFAWPISARARADSRSAPRATPRRCSRWIPIAARGRVVGTIGTQRPTKKDDQMSDRAIRDVLRRKLFRSRRHGRLWHAIPFEDSAELNDYLSDHLRFSRRVQWLAPAARRTTPLFVERAVRFEILEKL